MRYADRITFVKATDEQYDPDLGEYTYTEVMIKTLPCFVMDLGMAKSVQIFGDYQKTRKVVYLRQPYTDLLDHCLYKGKKYKVQVDKQFNTVFYLEGDDSICS
ncbi:hypothetical protein [Streptococcus equi]|uniref:Hypothetical phage protein n=1 Tax=Streptococcus equi subsp. equi (strain 4047) TaxID=553482 RepID=C0M6U4_STRE4|nr:hypothetical protein [Streptococcus equi]QBX24254.1 hypothetical protein Javan180_0021 [Streptococcus phage Javan180]HEL0635517.1 hypothetical protein [Streptococcus equi subsp. zooepidemicus]ASB97429.1 putative phage protein [Streptococcus equi subsp. equi]MBT1194677.1 hypothetical protein [Streptococcus equi subsp. equi]MBT1197507.1 hypothetical protein [Streptococcus equi subsp. equi]